MESIYSYNNTHPVVYDTPVPGFGAPVPGFGAPGPGFGSQD